MKHFYQRLILISMTFLLFSAFGYAQNKKKLWTKASQNQLSKKDQVFRKTQPKKAKYYQLNINGLKELLQNAPDRKTNQNSNVILNFPTADGSFEAFEVYEASIMAPKLQLKYSNIRSYSGKSIDNPENLIRFSVTPQGLHAMFLSPSKGAQFIDPYTKSDNNYIIYSKRDLPALAQPWKCHVLDTDFNEEETLGNSYQSRDTGDGMMRDFRTAIATTIEYSQFHWQAAGLTSGDTVADKKNAVMAAIVVTMTRNNFVYERDFSITMTLVGNNDSIVFINSDNFNNNNASTLINQSQTVIDNVIGNSNYDVGHTFSTGGGGLATLNSPCNNSTKARGITGGPSPVGDSYDIDFVAHELGHQFGAPHTFNGNQGNCAGGNREPTNAYEVGSGTTIMAYAGICGSDNVQSNSDPYFHQKSLQMIWSNVIGNSTCADQTATGNNVPTANAGSNYTIPISTPYKLTGSSTDADGTSSHTYTWEQYDLGPSGLPAENNATGPMVRSFEGSTNPTRYIPRLEDILIDGGVSTTWEKLASTSRNLKFRLTVRDNDPNGGHTAVDNMKAITTASAGPFRVTSQNTTGITWLSGSVETITWDVAGTNGNGVNTANVNILLSTNGGVSFDTVIASGVPNNGSFSYTVPSNIVSGFCRIMVEGAGNIFFNVNSEEFRINANVTTSCTTYASATNLNLAIPDGTGANTQGPAVFSDINVGDIGNVQEVRVTIDVSHTYVGDLLIQLQDPNDAQFSTIWNRNCNDADRDDINVTFQDGEAEIVCAQPTAGTYAPANPLSIFNGVAQEGNWQLALVDFYNGDTGTLNGWSIDICTTTVIPLNTEHPDLEATFSIYPNPNNGEFTVKFNGASGNVDLQVFDIRGRSILNKAYDSTGNFNQIINLGNVKSGMYLINVRNGLKTITKKVIVE